MFNLIRGPFVWLSVIVFIAGTAYQIFRFFQLSRSVKPDNRVYAIPAGNHRHCSSILVHGPRFMKELRYSVFTVHPLTSICSTIFHVLLMTTPVFVLGHNELINLALGVSLPSLPERITDILTLIVLGCIAFFMISRMTLAARRSISTASDFLILIMVAMPFLTGFLAYHQFFDYRSIVLIHMLSGELMIMVIPFSKLTHMIFFFLNRFLVINAHTLGRGSRVWS